MVNGAMVAEKDARRGEKSGPPFPNAHSANGLLEADLATLGQ